LKHFNIDVPASVSVGRRIFCPAMWNDQNITLCITFDLAIPMPQRDFYLAPITEFVDRVPKEITDKVQSSGNEDGEGNICCIFVTGSRKKFFVFIIKDILIIIKFIYVEIHRIYKINCINLNLFVLETYSY